jgi:glycosyltransferase involved in cell wall biosynthesis
MPSATPSRDDSRSPDTASRRIRVLHVIGELHDSGGAERFVAGLVTHLPSDRFKLWVCAPRGAAPDATASLDAAGVSLVTLGRRSKLDVHRLLGLAGLIRRERFDIVHAHLFGSNMWATTLSRMCGVPVVIAQEHTWSYSGNRMRAWLDGRVIGRLATKFVAVSLADAEKMVSIEKVPPDKVIVMPTAYIPHSSEIHSDIRAELGLADCTPLIATVTVMRRQKALDVLIRAFALVLESVPEAHLVLAGGGPCAEELVALAAELGLSHRVHFVGFRSDVDALLRRADVAAMSSAFEGTPLFAFECMANRVALVATSVGGLPDVVADGESGLLVRPGDPQALADGLVRLLGDPELRRALVDRAETRLADYTIESVAQRFSDLYTTLIEDHELGAAQRPEST